MPQRSQAFYGGRNALSLHDISQGSATLLSGFVLDGGATASVSGANQTVTATDKDTGVKSTPFLFPFAGARLIASADFSGATIRYNIGLRFLNSAGATLSEVTADYIASGRRSIEATVPDSTVYVQFISTRNDVTGASGSWVFTRPAIRTDSTVFAY